MRGGFGIFYEHPMLFNIRTSLQELPPYTVSGRLDDDDAEDAGLPLRMFNTNSAGQYPVELYQELLDARPNIRYMEFEEETTYMYRWSLTLQREIADWVLSAGYTGSRSLHLWIQDTSNVRKWDGWPENPAPGERKHWTDGADRINDNFGGDPDSKAEWGQLLSGSGPERAKTAQPRSPGSVVLQLFQDNRHGLRG